MGFIWVMVGFRKHVNGYGGRQRLRAKQFGCHEFAVFFRRMQAYRKIGFIRLPRICQ